MSYKEEDFDFLKNETDIFSLDKYTFFTINPDDYRFEENLDAISSTSTKFDYDTCSELSTPFDYDTYSELSTPFDYDTYSELSTPSETSPKTDLSSEQDLDDNDKERDFFSDKPLFQLRKERKLLQESIQRYREKREKRIWKVRVVYEVRRKLANERPRKNGRFTKN